MESEAHNMYRVRRTVFQMLRDRGYLVSKQEMELSFDDFKVKFSDAPSRELLTIQVQKKEDPTDRLFVFFPEDPKIGVKPIRRYTERMKDEKAIRAIIVVRSEMTPFAKKALDSMKPKVIFELFKENELLINITEHVLVPPHILLKADEKATLLEKYKLKESQLPRMQGSDPVARYMGLSRGQVVKIIRPSETAGRYVTYRLVV